MSDDDLTLSGYSSRRDPSSRPFSRRETPEHRHARRQGVLRSRRARRARPFTTLVVVGLLGFGAAFALAPLFAFRAVRSAAQFEDVQALGQSVDYDAVRQSLQSQARPPPVAAQPPEEEPAAPPADVDALLIPAGLAALMSGLPPDAEAPAPAGPFGGPVPRVRYWGFERARFGVVNPERRSRETVFTFQRQGLFAWKLVGVRLPEPLAAVRVETQ